MNSVRVKSTCLLAHRALVSSCTEAGKAWQVRRSPVTPPCTKTPAEKEASALLQLDDLAETSFGSRLKTSSASETPTWDRCKSRTALCSGLAWSGEPRGSKAPAKGHQARARSHSSWQGCRPRLSRKESSSAKSPLIPFWSQGSGSLTGFRSRAERVGSSLGLSFD